MPFSDEAKGGCLILDLILPIVVVEVSVDEDEADAFSPAPELTAANGPAAVTANNELNVRRRTRIAGLLWIKVCMVLY